LIQQVEDKEGSNGPSVTMPLHLLEQIRYQREKLESSLCHNDFIRRQLEGLMSSLSSQGGDNMISLWQKMKETAEQLEEARHKNQELETQLQEMRVQFEESKEKARLANDVAEKLQVG
jgi:chromosome segregation ATPase